MLNTKILYIIKITLFFVNYNEKINFLKKERIYLLAQSNIKRVVILKKKKKIS